MTRIVCKPGTVFGGFSRALLRVLDVLDQVAALELPGAPPALTITAGSNGQHAEGSAHYRYEAVDVRTHDVAHEAKPVLVALLRQQLGGAFFVDLEAPGTTNEHVHIQLRRGQRFDLPVAVAGRAATGGTA